MSGITHHSYQSSSVLTYDLESGHIVCSNNISFFSPGEILPETWVGDGAGVLNVQTGGLYFDSANVDVVFPLDRILKRTPFVNSKTTINKVSIYISGELPEGPYSYIRYIKLAHFSMNPEPPPTTENFVTDKEYEGDTDNWYSAYTTAQPVFTGDSPAVFEDIEVELDNKKLYAIIFRIGSTFGFDQADLTIHGFKIEYTIEGDI